MADPRYGSSHQQLRRELLRNPIGKICAKCKAPIQPGDLVDLGHTDDGRSYTGLEHRACNRADGARRGNAQRSRTGQNATSRRW